MRSTRSSGSEESLPLRSSGVRLRPARSDDATDIATIWHAGWRDGHRGHVPDELVRADRGVVPHRLPPPSRRSPSATRLSSAHTSTACSRTVAAPCCSDTPAWPGTLHDSPYTYFTSDALHLGEISLECSRAAPPPRPCSSRCACCRSPRRSRRHRATRPPGSTGLGRAHHSQRAAEPVPAAAAAVGEDVLDHPRPPGRRRRPKRPHPA